MVTSKPWKPILQEVYRISYVVIAVMKLDQAGGIDAGRLGLTALRSGLKVLGSGDSRPLAQDRSQHLTLRV